MTRRTQSSWGRAIAVSTMIHEGNIGMEGILKGDCTEEQQAAATAKSGVQ